MLEQTPAPVRKAFRLISRICGSNAKNVFSIRLWLLCVYRAMGSFAKTSTSAQIYPQTLAVRTNIASTLLVLTSADSVTLTALAVVEEKELSSVIPAATSKTDISALRCAPRISQLLLA